MNTETSERHLQTFGNVSCTSQSSATHGPKIKTTSFLSKSSSPKSLDRKGIDCKSVKNHIFTTERLSNGSYESETDIPEEFEKGGSTNSSTSTSKKSFGDKTVKSMPHGNNSVAKLNTVISSPNLYSKSFHYNNSPTNCSSGEKPPKGSGSCFERRNTRTLPT